MGCLIYNPKTIGKEMKKQQICILGSTGSIGTQALDVIRQHSDRYEVYCLTANNSVEKLAQQAREFKPAAVVIANEVHYDALQQLLNDLPEIKVYAGKEALEQIVSASNWEHDFGDGRGKIKSYGDYFLRLKTPGHSGIGIHGSTNNRESVPGRASEGCIRLKDEDIKDLAENYATEGMKVVIKAENVDDYPFEIHAMKRQKIERKRHFDATKTLTNEQIATATAKTGRVKTSDKTEPKEDKKPISKEELRIGGGKIPNEKGVHIGGGKLTAPEKK